MLYAIGEIILVIIGILIALSINNWNGERKLKQKESTLLHEFLNSIEGDLKGTELFYKPRLVRKKRGMDSLYSYIERQIPISDSLFMEFYQDIGVQPRIRFDNGPFSNLESIGLEIISNDSLRKSINRAYALSFPAYKDFADRSMDINSAEITSREKKIFTLKAVRGKDKGVQLREWPKVENIIENIDFYWILELESENYYEFIHRAEQRDNTLQKLKTQIEKELKK